MPRGPSSEQTRFHGFEGSRVCRAGRSSLASGLKMEGPGVCASGPRGASLTETQPLESRVCVPTRGDARAVRAQSVLTDGLCPEGPRSSGTGRSVSKTYVLPEVIPPALLVRGSARSPQGYVSLRRPVRSPFLATKGTLVGLCPRKAPCGPSWIFAYPALSLRMGVGWWRADASISQVPSSAQTCKLQAPLEMPPFRPAQLPS